MNIDIRDIITLDNTNEYVVASKILYNNINYYYLVNINNIKNILFCYEDNQQLVEINDNNLIKKISPLLYKKARNIIKDYNKKEEN